MWSDREVILLVVAFGLALYGLSDLARIYWLIEEGFDVKEFEIPAPVLNCERCPYCGEYFDEESSESSESSESTASGRLCNCLHCRAVREGPVFKHTLTTPHMNRDGDILRTQGARRQRKPMTPRRKAKGGRP